MWWYCNLRGCCCFQRKKPDVVFRSHQHAGVASSRGLGENSPQKGSGVYVQPSIMKDNQISKCWSVEKKEGFHAFLILDLSTVGGERLECDSFLALFCGLKLGVYPLEISMPQAAVEDWPVKFGWELRRNVDYDEIEITHGILCHFVWTKLCRQNLHISILFSFFWRCTSKAA